MFFNLDFTTVASNNNNIHKVKIAKYQYSSKHHNATQNTFPKNINYSFVLFEIELIIPGRRKKVQGPALCRDERKWEGECGIYFPHIWQTPVG